METDTAKAARWMKKELNALRRLRHDEAYVAQNRADVVDYAAGRGSIGGVTTGLLILAGHEGSAGSMRVLEGHEDGWERIDRGCLYLGWRTRLLACAYDADTRPDKRARANLDLAANAWTHAESLGASELRDWLSNRVRKIDRGDGSLGGRASPIPVSARRTNQFRCARRRRASTQDCYNASNQIATWNGASYQYDLTGILFLTEHGFSLGTLGIS